MARGRAGRPRARPGAVVATRLTRRGANRAHLRKRKTKAVIPEKIDQAANSNRRPGSVPPSFAGLPAAHPLQIPPRLVSGQRAGTDVCDQPHLAAALAY
ncbi:hypothetical protein OG905_37945 [Streptomyces sp. NBC_00322]|uniref:hypothetical protein n=1 Tax=Streptomyces sp. NBC_00322 TaxID=2975712 RepID=UPI002E289CFA|nr:hypothetical protein [Streptomyces sp. NBC_00322]